MEEKAHDGRPERCGQRTACHAVGKRWTGEAQGAACCARARVVSDVATLHLDALEHLSQRRLAARLARIAGVDRATVAWLMLLLGHQDRLVLDRATVRFITRAFGPDRSAGSAFGRRIARWRICRRKCWPLPN